MSNHSLKVVSNEKEKGEPMERAGSAERQKALDAALTQIERSFGKGSIMRLGRNDAPVEVGVVSTGSLGLD
ncbi:MAG TPA: hypothetical protein VHB73_02285, partial [Alphaproteobacteria bacterium]|nr:hypothetical protein [Alphaproteobacteria bacterium]